MQSFKSHCANLNKSIDTNYKSRRASFGKPKGTFFRSQRAKGCTSQKANFLNPKREIFGSQGQIYEIYGFFLPINIKLIPNLRTATILRFILWLDGISVIRTSVKSLGKTQQSIKLVFSYRSPIVPSKKITKTKKSLKKSKTPKSMLQKNKISHL